jgi:hypothetical protein
MFSPLTSSDPHLISGEASSINQLSHLYDSFWFILSVILFRLWYLYIHSEACFTTFVLTFNKEASF